MTIRYLGHACFQITEGRNSLVTDPYHSEATGLTLPGLTAQIATVSHSDPESNNARAVQGDPKVFDWPGEYETLGIHLKGIHSFHSPKEATEQKENIVFVITWNDIRLCHLGDQGCKLTPEQLEKMGDIDVLFIPVGGNTTIDAKKAQSVIEQIEPRLIIPMQYGTEKSHLKLDPLDSFLRLMGVKDIQPLPEFKFGKSDLPEENSKVVVLEITN